MRLHTDVPPVGVRSYGTHPIVPPAVVLTFRFSLDGETEISAMPDPTQSPAAYDAFVGGLHVAPALVAHDGSGCGIGVDVSPLSARRLFGVPAGALGSVVVGLSDLFGSSVSSELCERLHTTRGGGRSGSSCSMMSLGVL